MLKHGLLAGAALVMALGVSPLQATAQMKGDDCLPGKSEKAKEAFQRLDEDGNGMITLEELRSCLAQAGVEDKQEVQKAEEGFRSADLNVDDRLSGEEFEAASGKAKVEATSEEPKVVVKTNEGQAAQGEQVAQGEDMQRKPAADEAGKVAAGKMVEGALDEDAIRSDPSLLLDRTVMSETGEELGDIEEIVVDPSSNELYAVIGVGGFLGLGEQQVVVPLKDMHVQQDQVILPATEEDLRQMPEYRKDQWQPLT